MDRNCNKCINHTSGSCSAWECKGAVTVDDVRKNAIDECIKKLAESEDTILSDRQYYALEQLKESYKC